MRHWPNYLPSLAAIGAIMVLELVALRLGYDGLLLTTSIGLIAGIGGYTLHTQGGK